MKETQFIKQNKEKWKRFETLSKSSNSDPDELSKLFVEITDDLSYARTHYPKRTVRVYLNQLAQSVFLRLHKARKTVRKRLITFWTEELPLEMFRARKIMLFTFVFFIIAMAIGAVSTENDPNFPAIILGEGYLDMTDEFIEAGDPMAVYKTEEAGSMFYSIGVNNLRVALMSFAFGILFSVGTLFFMLYNGIMVGAFKYYFYLKGVFVVAASAVWLHGAFEISAIVIAGVAGMVVGNSLLFPGTYTRGQSLVIGGKRGIKIMLGTIPFIIIAAFIESYVTRHYLDMEPWQNWSIIFGSFGIILWYFVLYPWFKYRNVPALDIEKNPSVIKQAKLQKWRIRKLNETFTASLTWYRSVFNSLGGLLFTILGLHFISLMVYMALDPGTFGFIEGQEYELLRTNIWYYSDWKQIAYAIFGGNGDKDFVLIGIHLFFFSMSTTVIWSYFQDDGEKMTLKRAFRFTLIHFWKVLPFMLAIAMIIGSDDGRVQFFGLFIIPTLLLAAFSWLYRSNPILGIKTAFSGFFQHVGAFFISGLFLIVAHYFMVPLRVFGQEIPTNQIYSIAKSYVEMHAIPLMDNPNMADYMFDGLFYLLMMHLIAPLIIISMALQFFSVREKLEAKGLYERLNSFGKNSKVYETDFEDTL